MSDSDSDTSSSHSEEEVLGALANRPVSVNYCPTCTFPAEYCEFSGRLEDCKPWLETQAADTGGLTDKGKAKKKQAGEAEELPGGKKKKKASMEVVVSVNKRGGRKHITSVKGMEFFGHKLDEVARLFKKQLSCGASVVSNPGAGESIDIQGDVADTLIERLPTKFKVPKDCVFRMEDKQKVPAF